jgi:hypothetical protein
MLNLILRQPVTLKKKIDIEKFLVKDPNILSLNRKIANCLKKVVNFKIVFNILGLDEIPIQ